MPLRTTAAAVLEKGRLIAAHLGSQPIVRREPAAGEDWGPFSRQVRAIHAIEPGLQYVSVTRAGVTAFHEQTRALDGQAPAAAAAAPGDVRMSRKLLDLGRELHGPLVGFQQLQKTAMSDGAINHKTKELMALAISIVQRAEPCMAFHAHNAIVAGANHSEIMETLGVAVMMGGGPAVLHAAKALEILRQFESKGLAGDGQRSYGP